MVVLLLNFGFLLFIGMEDTENIQTTGDEAKKGDYKNNFPTVGINKDAVLKMFDKVVAFKMEERDLALDKFKNLPGMASSMRQRNWSMDHPNK